jgi:hypothetical protein
MLRYSGLGGSSPRQNETGSDITTIDIAMSGGNPQGDLIAVQRYSRAPDAVNRDAGETKTKLPNSRYHTRVELKCVMSR